MTTNVIIVVEGGMVQNICQNSNGDTNIKYFVIDYDRQSEEEALVSRWVPELTNKDNLLFGKNPSEKEQKAMFQLIDLLMQD